MSWGLGWVGHCRRGDTDCPTQAFAHMAIKFQRQVALRTALTPSWFSGGWGRGVNEMGDALSLPSSPLLPPARASHRLSDP